MNPEILDQTKKKSIKLILGINDLATLRPDIAAQWHPTLNQHLSLSAVTPGSSRMAWWLGKCGHEWEAIIASRTKLGNNCPYCARKKLLTGFNDLATTHPQLAAQWHPTKNKQNASDYSAGSPEKVWWQDKLGHEWQATINSRKTGNGCPYCGNRIVLSGFNDLGSSEYQEIVSQWHPTKNGSLTPADVMKRSNKNIHWICQEGHEWVTNVSNRTSKGSGCKKCQQLMPKTRNPLVSDTSLLSQWHPDNERSAHQVTTGSLYKALWQCEKFPEHTYRTSVASRARGGNCTICANLQVLAGYNDLASQYPHVAAEWHPTLNGSLSPQNIVSGYDKPVWWRCEENHEWENSPYRRTAKNHGCPACIGRTTTRQTVSDHPALLAQWSPKNTMNPSQISFRSTKQAWWVCSKDERHEYVASVASRNLDGSDCIVCIGSHLIQGVNDLATTHPSVAALWHPTKNGTLTPHDITPNGSEKRPWWQCPKDKNHVWQTHLYTMVKDISSSHCPRCAISQNDSQGERDIAGFFLSLGVEVERNNRDKTGREIDIYLPQYGLGVEFNGLYWHSDKVRDDKNYHLKKLLACEQAGVRLYTVWEDDWKLRRTLVLRYLAYQVNALERLPEVSEEAASLPSYYFEKVGARKLVVRVVSLGEARAFFDEHHIQGFVGGSEYLGLYDENNHLRAALVAGTRKDSTVYQLQRYATAGIVPGGFTKLLKAAEKAWGVTKWITFADGSISQGDLYTKHGFQVDGVLAPNYSYMVNGQREHKFNYRLKRFREDASLRWEEGLTERELAELNNMSRIWDYGKKRYVKIV